MRDLADQDRRAAPRIFETDWLVLRGMRRVIAETVASVARPGAVALDFGCGIRPYEQLVIDTGCQYQGADFDGPAGHRIEADGRAPSVGDASVDVVLSFQVLEHVRDLTTYFAEARRMLRPGGAMILSTHGSWLYHPHPEDHRRWTREGLIGEISAHGFTVEHCESVVGPLAWTTLLRLTCFAFAVRKLPMIGKALSGLLALLMNARAFVEDKVTPAWVTRDNACVYVTLCRPA